MGRGGVAARINHGMKSEEKSCLRVETKRCSMVGCNFCR